MNSSGLLLHNTTFPTELLPLESLQFTFNITKCIKGSQLFLKTVNKCSLYSQTYAAVHAVPDGVRAAVPPLGVGAGVAPGGGGA